MQKTTLNKMIRQEEMSAVLNAQAEIFRKKEKGLSREALESVPAVSSFATIITGIRRCGKSTLLRQLMSQKYESAFYLNFEDIRLADFETNDFVRLQKEIEQRNARVLFFDEIQIIPKWEIFIHQMLNEEYTIFITGSNATLLSSELGTHLTGRHIPMELFPFSYSEYLSFRNLTADDNSASAYLHDGGIPEYVKSQAEIILNTLIDDILIRDIAIRNSIKDVNSLRALAVYLLSNVGNLVSAGKLVGMFDIKATSTFLDYFSFYQHSYLLAFVPIFSYSLKVQSRNPKKVYAMDLGLVNEASANFSDATGHKLENLIFLHLRRKSKDICYYKDKGECDFVIIEKGKVTHAIQVCHQINDQNFKREYNGLLEAMEAFNLAEGVIVTTNQADSFEKDGRTIHMVPANQFLLS